jgi:hypothetical protein
MVPKAVIETVEAREAKEAREAVEVMAVMSTTADMAALEDEGGLECQADEEEGREEQEDEVEGEVVDKIFTTSKHLPEMYELPFTGTISQ